MANVSMDRQNLQPVDNQQHNGWLSAIYAVFRQKQLTVPAPFGGGAALAARAVQPDRFLTPGIADQYNQRIGPTANKYVNPNRGAMAPIPTPQALIRQVTGIGDPSQGR
jgi:hypothetical protein